MTTNLLAMPLVNLTVITGTNEDWIDSILFLADDGSGDPPQLDLTGISFAMEVRHTTPEHEVVIRASTADGTLMVGVPPNYGYLLIKIPHELMLTVVPNQYVADIVGWDDVSQRRCITIDLEVAYGVTRP
jgi:hypothetical protein